MNIGRLATSYALCFAWVIGLGGLHRLYNGKIGTGLLWLLTWGVFGVGQFVDLFTIPTMVDEHEFKLRSRLGVSANGVPLNKSAIAATVHHPAYDKLMVKLVKAAKYKDGKLTVTQAVMDTGASFSDVEAVLKQMVKTGYVSTSNHPVTGVIIYHFHEL